MSNNKNNIITKSLWWFFARFAGLLLLLIGIFLIISFFSYSQNDPYYGFQTSERIQNLAGLFGSYTAGTLLNYFDWASYVLFPFFIIWGAKIFLGKKINLKLIRIIILILSILLVCGFYNNYSLYENIVGGLLHDNIVSLFYQKLDYDKVEIITIVVLGFLLIPTILFSLSIKNLHLAKFLKLITRIFYTILIYIIKMFTFILKSKRIKITKESFKRDPSINNTDINKNDYNDEIILNKTDKINKKNIRKRLSPKININQQELNFRESFDYDLPSLNLLTKKTINEKGYEETNKNLEKKGGQLENVLAEFGIQGRIVNIRPGPIVTMYELEPSAGTKAIRIINLSDDIARSMSALSTRITSQPGKNTIGIEIPNIKRTPVFLGELLSNEDFLNHSGNLILALGKDISGKPVMTDLEKMPHLLIAGTTGSGKSVGLNSMIVSLLYKFKPSECKFILIDPKMLELSIYEDIPHLMSPVVTDPHKAIVALKWAVKEMERRYKLMNHAGVKSILSYNSKIEELLKSGTKMYREITTGVDPDSRLPIVEKQEIPNEKFPYIVVVIDEMADLMMVAGKDVEQAIQRLAQMARAAGIHLIMATQRPSVDVVTGTIKANFPSRISYHVASKFDSRTIVNEIGAEQLLGNGDMLFMENGAKIVRLHGGFVSEKEIYNIVKFIKKQSAPDFSKDITSENSFQTEGFSFNTSNDTVDSLYEKAVELVLREKKASTSFIQRHLQIGYNRAARIIEQMEKEGLVSESNHVGKREILKNNT